MLDDIPEKWGPKFGVDEGAVPRRHEGPNAIRFVAPASMALVVFNSDRATSGASPAGSLEIIPAEAELYAQRSVEKQNLLLAVDAKRLERLEGVVFDKETFELYPPGPGEGDSRAHQLAHWIRYEIENRGLSWNECVDALITVFAAHLHSASHNRSMRPYVGGLPPVTWRRVDDFIQSNLSGALTLERLACIARLSPSHFARAFKQTAGQSPHQYVMSSRLAHARKLIMSTDRSLSQIAKLAGFSSNSHMTTLMRRAWNMTPTDLRKRR